MEYKRLSSKIEDYLVITYDMGKIVGGRFCDRIKRVDIHLQKRSPIKIWNRWRLLKNAICQCFSGFATNVADTSR